MECVVLRFLAVDSRADKPFAYDEMSTKPASNYERAMEVDLKPLLYLLEDLSFLSSPCSRKAPSSCLLRIVLGFLVQDSSADKLFACDAMRCD